MNNGRHELGCRGMVAWTAVILLAAGMVPFIPIGGTGAVAGFAGIVAIVGASLTMAACALSAAIDRVAPDRDQRPRGALTVMSVLAIVAVGGWSVSVMFGRTLGAGAVEALPLVVDPVLAAVIALLFLRRSERPAAIAFALTAAIAAAILIRLLAAVGPTYG